MESIRRSTQFRIHSNRAGTPVCLAALIVAAAVLDVRAADLIRDYEIAPRQLARLPFEPYAAGVSADCSLFATGHNDGTVIVWRTQDGTPVLRLDGHLDTIAGVGFSAAGDRLATASYDGTVRIWSTADGTLSYELESQSPRLTCVAISTDGACVASGAYDGHVRIWNDPVSSPVVSTAESAGAIRCVAFAPDGQRVAAGDDAGNIRLLEATTASAIQSVNVDAGGVRSLVFAPDGETLVSGSAGGRLSAWNAQTLDAQGTDADAAPTHEHAIVAVAFTQDGRLVASGDQSGDVQIRDATTRELTSTLRGHGDQILAVGFPPSAETVVTVSRDRLVNVWKARLPPTPRLGVLGGAAGKLWSVAVSPDQSTVFAAGRKGYCGEWDLPSGQLRREITGFGGTIDDLNLSADGRHLAVCGWREPVALIVDTQTGEKVAERTAEADLRCVRFSPDGKTLASAREDGKVDLWNWQDGEEVRTVNVSEQAVYDLRYSPDGTRFIACGGDWRTPEPGFVKAFTTTDLQTAGEFQEHQHAVRAAGYSSDGRRLASTDETGLTVIWNVETGLPLTRLNNATGSRPLAWSPDDGQLAVGLHDGTIHVWDVASEELVRRLQCEDDVFALAFVGDGSVLLSASGESRIEIWPLVDSSPTVDRIRGWVP